MSSNNSVAQWERQWAHLIARIRPKPATTRSRILLAETNVQRAKREVADDPDAALIFAEQALINAADALLARDGYSAIRTSCDSACNGGTPALAARRWAACEGHGDYEPRDRAAALISWEG